MLEHSLVFVFPFAMAFAAVTDLFTMTIPNRLTLGLAVAFFLLAPIAGLGWQDILSHMAGGATMLLAGILLFSLGWLGGGDAKLLAAASLWLGFDQLAMFLTYTAAFGGALALAILAYRRHAGGAPSRCPVGRPVCTPRAKACPMAWPSRQGPYSFTRRPLGMRPLPAETPV